MTYIIIGALLLAAGFLYLKTYSMRLSSNSCFENINPTQFKKIVAEHPTAVVLDVRTKQEYQSGNIKASTNIDVLEENFSAQIQSLDKDLHYLIYCRSGMRSAKAAGILCELGFTNVYNLTGGYNAWK